MYKAQVRNNFIGIVSPNSNKNDTFLGSIDELNTLCQIYKITEIIFCAKDISNTIIIDWMCELGTTVDYKIVPEGSSSIIGSSSKNTKGQLYTIEVTYDIDEPMNRRNKRVFDVLMSLLSLITLPIGIFIVKKPFHFIQNILKVLVGNRTWVGYSNTKNTERALPKITKGIISTADAYSTDLNDATNNRLNFFYAKDYSVYDDLDIFLKGKKHLGN